MTYWCHDWRRHFSVKTHSVKHRSPRGCRVWVAAIYPMLTHLKAVPSTKLVRDLGIMSLPGNLTRFVIARSHRGVRGVGESVRCFVDLERRQISPDRSIH